MNGEGVNFSALMKEVNNPQPEEWPEPIDLFGCFEPPAFPLEVLPEQLRGWVNYRHAATGADRAGYAMAALTACCAAIKDHVCVELNGETDWYESPRIWTALVGRPSTKKSPILKAAMKPLHEINGRLVDQYEEAMAAYLALDNKEQRAQPAPKSEQFILEDVTFEATNKLFADNPGGLLLHQDELSGFFGSMDKYNDGKGGQADRAYWLKSFNGESHSISRVSRGNIRIRNLSVCMLGGIQPEPMRKIAGATVDDGLIQRLFTIILRDTVDCPDEASRGMLSHNQYYSDLINRLFYMQPTTFLLSLDARRAFKEAEQRFMDDARSLEEVNPKLSSHVGKYAGLLARIATALHCMHLSKPPLVMERHAIEAAEHLLSDFLLPHAYAFYSRMMDEVDPEVMKIAGYVLAHPEDNELTERKVVRGRKGVTAEEGRRIFQRLISLGWVRELPMTGRERVPRWVPNPKVHEKFAAQAKIERERREKAHQFLTSLAGKGG